MIVVVIDMISVCFMFMIFYKVKRLNNDYIRTLDKNVIRMSDFSVEV